MYWINVSDYEFGYSPQFMSIIRDIHHLQNSICSMAIATVESLIMIHLY
jgi:hypothetical protein